MRAVYLGGAFFVATFLFAVDSRAEGTSYLHKALLINSYHQNLPWTADVTRGIEDFIATDNDHKVDLLVENMDTKRISSPEYLETFARLLHVKYDNAPPDLIITSDNNALSFVIDRRAELFPHIPIVFCGVNDFNLAMLKGEKGITGVPEVPKIRSTANVALRLLPETKKLLVVHDFLETGHAWKAEAAKQLAGFPIEVVYAPPLPRDELLAYLAALPPHTAVLLTVYFADGTGTYHPADESLSLMADASSAPIFGSLDFQLGDGIVGGDLIGGYLQGNKAASMVIDIFHGGAPSLIPIASEGTSALSFDWEQARRLGIDLKPLPPGAVIVNEPEEDLSVSPLIALATIGLIILEGAIVTLLVINIIRRRKAEDRLRISRVELERKVVERTREFEQKNEALRREVAERRQAMESLADSEERYRQMFHLNAAVKLLIDPSTGNILEANEAAAYFYGYRRDNLLAMKISDLNILSPDEVKNEMMAAKSQKRTHFNFRHRLATGDIRDVEVYSGPLKVRDQTLLFSIIIDVTDRRRVEQALRNSEEAYRALFETVRLGLLHLDRDEVIVQANHAAALLFGTTPEKMIGKNWRQFLHPHPAISPLADSIVQDANGTLGGHLRHRGITSTGDAFSMNLTVIPDSMIDNKPQGYVLTLEAVSGLNPTANNA